MVETTFANAITLVAFQKRKLRERLTYHASIAMMGRRSKSVIGEIRATVGNSASARAGTAPHKIRKPAQKTRTIRL